MPRSFPPADPLFLSSGPFGRPQFAQFHRPILFFDDFHQMDHFPYHPPNGLRILKPDGPVHPGQAQPAKGPLLGFGSVDPAPHQGHFNHLSFHGSLPAFIHWTQIGTDKNGLRNRQG